MPAADGTFWWDWSVSAVVAVATFAAVLVALFGQAFRTKFFPPRLSLRLLDPRGEKAVVLRRERMDGQVRESMVDARYYHLRVANARRWSPANQVQVILLQVQERAANGEFRITWTGTIPLGWRHQELYPLLRTIGAAADADLCSVNKEGGLHVHALLKPFNLELLRRQPTTLRLLLQAQGSEAESQPIRVQIAWDGKWHDGDDEMRRHLVVEPA